MITQDPIDLCLGLAVILIAFILFKGPSCIKI